MTMILPKPILTEPDYAVRGVNRARLSAIREHAGKSVLDVGCGNGGYVLALSGDRDIRGVDYRPFDAWNEKPALFSVADAQQLDLPANSVDTVVSFETLEHLPDPVAALRRYFLVCRSNVIVTVPNCALTTGMRSSGLIYNHWVDRTHVNFWDIDTACRLIESVGFKVTLRTHINPVSPSAMTAEAMGLSGWSARVAARLLRALERRRYWMTCLIVADKPREDRPLE
jgi:SAM-dependent methyltransferase